MPQNHQITRTFDAPIPPPGFLTMAQRQQILILYLTNSDLTSSVAAWSFFDGADGKARDGFTINENTAPYRNVLEAMKAGWRVIQMSEIRQAYPGEEYHNSFLKFENVLERMVEVDG